MAVYQVFRFLLLSPWLNVLFLVFALLVFGQPKTANGNLLVENINQNALQLSQSEQDYLKNLDSQWTEILKGNSLFTNTPMSQTEVLDSVSEEVLKQRLSLLNTKTPIEINYNSVVHAYVEKYLRMGAYFGRVMGLAEFYYPLFEEKLAEHNIPEEIKHLSIVESKLDARANSRVGAKGLWQFMYQTGKGMGLEVNSYVDERYDPIKSTEAAAKYLKYLHKNLGDWNLALASYNCGMGNVNKAINRSGGYKNYWNIRHKLPRETRGYIPSFIAANYIMNFYKEQNIRPDRLKFSYFDTDTVWVSNKLTFNRLSEYLKLTKEELRFLNPQYKLDVIPKIKGKKYVLRLPKTKIDFFTKYEQEIYGKVKSDDLAKEKPIAKEEKTKYLPTSSNYNAKEFHRVQRGDTLYKIAQKYGLSVEELKSMNKLRSNVLTSGQYLRHTKAKPGANQPSKS